MSGSSRYFSRQPFFRFAGKPGGSRFMIDSTEHYIRNRLETISNRIRQYVIIDGIVTMIAFLLIPGSILLYFDALVLPESLVVMALVFLFLLFQCYFVYRKVVGLLYRRSDPRSLVHMIERLIPAFQGRLIASFEER
jgi:hypothetical protein